MEDVVREAADLLADDAQSYKSLPGRLRSHVNERVRSHQWQIEDLTDDGWRQVVRDNATYRTSGNSFNTPSAKKVDQLMEEALGLKNLSHSWEWRRFPHPKASVRLDESIQYRGEIVHTGNTPEGLSRNWIDTYGNKNIHKLVEVTDARVGEHLSTLVGTNPFA